MKEQLINLARIEESEAEAKEKSWDENEDMGDKASERN
jgi:hypothetical protein